MRNTQLSDLAVNAQADALARLLDGGFVDVMDGTQPKTSDIGLTGQTVLTVFGFGTPSFRLAAGGVIDANSLTANVATGSGKPTWFRAYRADHKTVVFDGSAGKKNVKEKYNMELPADYISAGVTVGCSLFQHSVVKSTSGV